MARQLEVHFLPALTAPDELSGRTVVVVDILRATTTMLHALQAGVRAVIPCAEVEDARRQAASLGRDGVLGGERAGIRIEGFDLGNSPAEYTQQKVGGRTLVMTTTNGTRALQKCSEAARVLIGGFVNFSALLCELAESTRLAILCAGTDGRITGEDVLFAGALISGLREQGTPWDGNDEAELAAAAWSESIGDASHHGRLVSVMRTSRGGRNLVALGYDADIEQAARLDTAPVIGELRLDSWRIVAAVTPSWLPKPQP